MGYELRMHNEIRDWLIDLRATEPELARLVGGAVLAMLDAGARASARHWSSRRSGLDPLALIRRQARHPNQPCPPPPCRSTDRTSVGSYGGPAQWPIST